jgi:hypothetical protein
MQSRNGVNADGGGADCPLGSSKLPEGFAPVLLLAASASRLSAQRLKFAMMFPAAEQSQTKMQGLKCAYHVGYSFE